MIFLLFETCKFHRFDKFAVRRNLKPPSREKERCCRKTFELRECFIIHPHLKQQQCLSCFLIVIEIILFVFFVLRVIFSKFLSRSMILLCSGGCKSRDSFSWLRFLWIGSNIKNWLDQSLFWLLGGTFDARLYFKHFSTSAFGARLDADEPGYLLPIHKRVS